MSEIAEIRARHEAGERGSADADREWLLAEVERLRDGLECLMCGRIVREILEDGR